MNIKVQTIQSKSIMTKSRLPASDYAVNPYLGCPHGCKYCYACFMKRFSNHDEPWGEFVDIKSFPPIKNPQQYSGKSIFMGSVTDCYNPYEAEYCKTREILQQFVGVDVAITISTKSNLITRDIDVLKKLNRVIVAFSINTTNEAFRADMDKAASIHERIEAMKELYGNGISTATFISPIFPALSDVENIIQKTHSFCNVYWLENLNLRGSYKHSILQYISCNYPQYKSLYEDIYLNKNQGYWIEVSKRLEQYATEKNINMINYFYHDQIRKQ